MGSRGLQDPRIYRCRPHAPRHSSAAFKIFFAQRVCTLQSGRCKIYRVTMNPDNFLIVADSDHDANMLYAVGMFVPDPFIYLRIRGRPYIVMSDLEIDRARKQAPHCRALALMDYQNQLRK